jgi:threonyl-tRNA synthetase
MTKNNLFCWCLVVQLTCNHQVISPNVFKMDLWDKQDKMEHYKEDMFTFQVLFLFACGFLKESVGCMM